MVASRSAITSGEPVAVAVPLPMEQLKAALSRYADGTAVWRDGREPAQVPAAGARQP